VLCTDEVCLQQDAQSPTTLELNCIIVFESLDHFTSQLELNCIIFFESLSLVSNAFLRALARFERFNVSAHSRSSRARQHFCALSLVSNASTFRAPSIVSNALTFLRTLSLVSNASASLLTLARLERFSVSAHSRSSRTLQYFCGLSLISNT
jgi:hypothetical protein